MELKHFDVLVPGHYFCDIIFSGLPKFPEMGLEVYTGGLTVVPGGIMNTVVALQRLGVHVGWIGALGNDFFSRYVRERGTTEGVDLSLLDQQESSLRRVTVALSSPEDRAFVTFVDPAPDVVGMLLSRWEDVECSHLHFHRLMVDERLIPLFDQCRQRGIFVSMDCQHRIETLDMPLVQAVLSHLSVFMPNASEAMRLTGKDNVEAAAFVITAFVPYLVIKDGTNGAHAWHNGDYNHVPALEGLQVLDTTGAGDVFNAGFLAAHLAGKTTVDCLHWGNIAAGLSTEGYGGCSTAPTLAQLRACLR